MFQNALSWFINHTDVPPVIFIYDARYRNINLLKSLKTIPSKLTYSEVNFCSPSSPPILWLDKYGNPHWNEAAEREILLNPNTIWDLGYEHVPHRRSLFDYNRVRLDYNFSVSCLINHTYEHIYHEPSLSSDYLNTWKSRNRPWGQSTTNLPGKSYQVTWQDRLFASFLYYIFVLYFHRPAPRIRQLTDLLSEHWSTYLHDKNGQSLDTLGGLFIRRGDKAREDSFWKKHRHWRNISMYVKGIVDEEQRRNQTFLTIFVMTDDSSVMKSIHDYANPHSKGIDEPYARKYLRGREILYNVFAPQACFDPFIRIGFEQFLVSLEFLVRYAKFI
ncbi:unnamed protein product, partial [Rotaria sordida]